MAKFPVKFYYGGGTFFGTTQNDYPKLTNSPGSLISLLDAVLVNGYGDKTVTSLVVDANRKATITASNHGYNVPARFEIYGADQTDINGEWEVESVPDANTITFTTPASLANTTITGNVHMRVPPLGWDKVFSDTNRATYRARVGNRHFLYIDDTGTNGALPGAAKVRPFEYMDSINEASGNSWMAFGDSLKNTNTGTSSSGQSIATNQAVSWMHYIDSGNSGATGSSTDIGWTIIGCDRFFYLSIQNMFGNNTDPHRTPYMFGDFPSIKLDDRKNIIIRGAECFDPSWAYSNFYGRDSGRYFSFQKGHAGNFLASGFTQNTGNKYWTLMPPGYGFAINDWNYPVGAFDGPSIARGPNPASGGYIFMGPCYLYEDYEGNEFSSGMAYAVLRGFAPGFYVVPTNFLTTDYTKALIKQNQLLNDSKNRRYMAMGIYGHWEYSYYGRIAFHFISVDEDWFALDGTAQQL
jgi:hypothetical protein